MRGLQSLAKSPSRVDEPSTISARRAWSAAALSPLWSFDISGGVVYRVSGTETVAGGRARRRATPGTGVHSHGAPRQWCGELSAGRADRRAFPALMVCFDSPHRLRGATSNPFLSVGSASARATHGYPLRTAKRGTRHRGAESLGRRGALIVHRSSCIVRYDPPVKHKLRRHPPLSSFATTGG